MNAMVIDRPKSREIAKFLDHVSQTPSLLLRLKAAPDDSEFISIAVESAKAAGIALTSEMVHDQMMEDRRIVRLMPLDEVERIADGLLGARLSGGHRSHMPPAC